MTKINYSEILAECVFKIYILLKHYIEKIENVLKRKYIKKEMYQKRNIFKKEISKTAVYKKENVLKIKIKNNKGKRKVNII